MSTWRSRIGGLATCCLAAAGAWADAATAADYTPMRVAMHVHTDYSTGQLSLSQVVARARAAGLDALIITDDDLLEVAYGLPPWRHLLRFGRQERSLLAEGSLEAYLAEIRHLDRTYPDIVLVDAVESAPYYRWETDLSGRRWTVRGWNKHLTAVGLGSADAYRALPILGGAGMWQIEPDLPRMVRILWPLAGLLYALWLGRDLHRSGVRLLLGGVCLLFLVDGAVSGFRSLRFSPYRDEGAAPYQAYVDAVARLGGLSYWGHPEGISTIPPVSVAGGLLTVRSVTDKHAGDLVATQGYTGFAALYADNITATEPAHEWDQVLIDYLRGGRAHPVWGTGEADYHGDPDERIDDIQTVVLASERSRAGLLAALARGRGYAVRGGEEALGLPRWTVTTTRGAALAGQRVGTGGRPWRVAVTLDKGNGAAEEVHLRLVRGDESGRVEVVGEVTGMTPLELEHVDALLAPSRQCYYRVMARSRTSILTSNPIFLRGEAVAPRRL